MFGLSAAATTKGTQPFEAQGKQAASPTREILRGGIFANFILGKGVECANVAGGRMEDYETMKAWMLPVREHTRR